MTDEERKAKMEEVLRGPPTMEGPAGKAWHLPQELRTPGGPILEVFLVHCPKAHPFWSWWFTSVIHLRPLPGLNPAVLRYPEAQYEFSTYAVEPPRREPHDKLAQPDMPPRLMQPLDVEVQFHGVSDQDAARVCSLAVRSMVDGVAYPDSDYRSAWEHLIPGTVEHLKAGRHPVN